jgi:hypothetical protein
MEIYIKSYYFERYNDFLLQKERGEVPFLIDSYLESLW